jgi:uncharacterized SAM-binding protein YcdF (DUF218 family)
MPLSIAMILFGLGLWMMYKNSYKRAKILLSASFVWLFLCSYSPLVDTLLYKLETTYPTLHKAPKDIHYIYLLGGGHHTNNSLPITSQIEPISVVRLTEAIRLYRQLPNAKIILSGYSGLFDKTPHATMQYNLATSLGVPAKDIIVQPSPKDTKEEALVAKQIIGKKPFVLVSSASHLPRAMQIFASQNLHPIPAPTNHLANNNINLYNIFSSEALYKATILWHEYIGIIWQQKTKILKF